MSFAIGYISIFLVLVSAFHAVSASEGDMTAQNAFDRSKPYALVKPGGDVEFSVNDDFLGNVNLYIHGLEWAFRGQSDAEIEEDSGQEGNTVRRFEGSIEIPESQGKRMEFSESIANPTENGFDLDYTIHFPEAVAINGYQVSFSVSSEYFSDQKILLIGDEVKEIEIPEEYGEMHLGFYRVNEVKIAPGHKDGFSIHLDQSSSIMVQDNRGFRSDRIELRFNFHERGAGEKVPAGETVSRRFSLRFNRPLFLIHDEDQQTDRNNTKNWIPYVLPWDDAPFDFSFLNEKPAGTHGFLKVDGDQFVFEDGTPARFWGTCFSASANFPTHEQSEKIARRLAGFGVNIVRTHHADAGWSSPNLFEFDRDNPKKGNTLSFDPESLDRYDYLIYCLKQEGIYVYLDQLVHRKFKPGDRVDAVDELSNAAKPYSNFDPRLIELQKKFSHDLWNHVNPYTKMAYRDEPAIVLMEFANENDLFTQRVTLEPYRSRLEEKYRAWAEDHGITIGPEPVDFTEFTEPIMEFLHEVQRSYYIEMRDYLRGIGVKIPITGSNWSRNIALLSALQVTDYTDSHSYWDHPSGGKFNNRPMVGSETNVFRSLSFNRSLGKPFFVSEWDQPWPNEWRAEHALAMAAVAAFQGWNGLTVYTYRHSTSIPIDHLSGSFETFNDPSRFGLFYHAALIFRRGDVRPASKTVVVNMARDDVFRSPNPGPWSIPALVATNEKHKLVMAIGASREATEDMMIQPGSERIVKAGDNEVTSDTRQMYRNWEKRIGSIDTPFTKAAYGFIGDVESIQMQGLSLKVNTPFATIALSSLTDDPIEKSERLLLTAVGRSENTGFVYNILHTKMLGRGQGPILIEPVEANIKLTTHSNGLKVWAVDPDGERIKQIPARLDDGNLVFDIGKEGRTIYYLLEKSY